MRHHAWSDSLAHPRGIGTLSRWHASPPSERGRQSETAATQPLPAAGEASGIAPWNAAVTPAPAPFAAPGTQLPSRGMPVPNADRERLAERPGPDPADARIAALEGRCRESLTPFRHPFIIELRWQAVGDRSEGVESAPTRGVFPMFAGPGHSSTWLGCSTAGAGAS